MPYFLVIYMKKLMPIILAVLFIIVCVFVSVKFLLLPDYVSDTSDVTSYVSNANAVYFSDLIDSSNSILTATIIQTSTDGDITVYTLQIEEMLKGKNITGIGHLHVKNNVALKIGQKYLIFSNSDNKYNYKEPFSDAPFVLELTDGGKLNQINGIGKTIISDIQNAHIDFIRHQLAK